MRVSVVIPTNNRRNLLDQTLYYISKQELSGSCEMEVIVVDDSSTDGTRELVEEYQRKIGNCIYSFHDRITYCPASVRNQGIRECTGDVIVLLDCGVLIHPDFVERVGAHYTALPEQVLLHYTVGLHTAVGLLTLTGEQEKRTLLGLSPETLFHKIQTLAEDPEWADSRDGIFTLVDDQLDRMAAPWTLALSCAMSISAPLLKRVEGFDEAFEGWGSEDLDLGYRLYQTGAPFFATRDCMALHIPHEKHALDERTMTDGKNRIILHRKAYNLDTELNCYYKGPYYDQVLSYYNHLALMYIMPLYSAELLGTLTNKFLKDITPSLLIGSDYKSMAHHLPTTHNFVHNRSTFAHFRQWFPQREIRYLLGCDTPYTDGFFKVTMLTDFVRLIPKMLQAHLFEELQRISQEIFVLYTSYFVSPIRQYDGQQWSSIDDIKRVLEPLQLQLVFVNNISGTSIFKVQRR